MISSRALDGTIRTYNSYKQCRLVNASGWPSEIEVKVLTTLMNILVSMQLGTDRICDTEERMTGGFG